MKQLKLNKSQKRDLARITCRILEQNQNLDIELKSCKIPKKAVKKINKALDIIADLNRMCFNKQGGKK